jgi:hypothetical protein
MGKQKAEMKRLHRRKMRAVKAKVKAAIAKARHPHRSRSGEKAAAHAPSSGHGTA